MDFDNFLVFNVQWLIHQKKKRAVVEHGHANCSRKSSKEDGTRVVEADPFGQGMELSSRAPIHFICTQLIVPQAFKPIYRGHHVPIKLFEMKRHAPQLLSEKKKKDMLHNYMYSSLLYKNRYYILCVHVSSTDPRFAHFGELRGEI